jgi:hypothetical protein
MNISPAALRRLQVLYGQFEAHTLDVDRGREARLAWASAQCGRTVATFSDLNEIEGKRLIDTLQGILGVKAPSKTPRRRMSRRAAENAGTSGRRDQKHGDIVMASAVDLQRIQDDLTRLGWDQARLEAFLRSSRSPLKGRQQILTLADSNKVHWALKHINPRGKEQLAS